MHLTLPDSVDPTAYGIELIQTRQWFEAHEVLEIPWRGSSGVDRLYLQGLIQGAVSLEHLRRNNPRGAQGQWQKARVKLVAVPAVYGGLDVGGWVEAMDRFYAEIGLDALVEAASRVGPMPPLDLPPDTTWPVPRRVGEPGPEASHRGTDAQRS